jgi:hypothetical protein
MFFSMLIPLLQCSYALLIPMNQLQLQQSVRDIFYNLTDFDVEGLLVDMADWGINIRVTLNNKLCEIDLVQNWDGYELIFYDEHQRSSLQIDEISDLSRFISDYL